MLAFVSPTYFERIWCVFELATLCRAHRRELAQRLMLVSLEWGNVLNPFKSAYVFERFSYLPSDLARECQDVYGGGCRLYLDVLSQCGGKERPRDKITRAGVQIASCQRRFSARVTSV